MSIKIGILELLECPRGTVVILMMGLATLVSMTGHMTPTFGAVMATVGSIFMMVHAAVAINQSPNLPPRGQP